MAPTTFHRFSELPAELRDLIWELGLPDPVRRYPELMWTKAQSSRPTPSRVKDPAMLRVNRESRAIALQFYERRDHYKCRYGRYFNLEVDEICFEGMYLFPGWRRPVGICREEEFNIDFADRRTIKKIVLAFPWSYASSSPFNFVRTAGEVFLSCLWHFDTLKTITFEIWQDDRLDIMDIMAPRMHELDVSTSRMLRARLSMMLDHVLQLRTSNEPDYRAPTWRIQVVAGNGT
ncbi:hypothetical protein L207DRAFT_89109 [Hyaloscypha variabilis F]|uniref:2EXR domain-containing protein n=1 Tax=Hyaloscypha variabilis (strain UAMH 11265 / GT02V1 / F) TaxID=1149755 RepID=A0A2J6RDZ7_HYAVF|nr:hypothetical protein L207DRAFT_89109 [Hyaloscypha variabilis F]